MLLIYENQKWGVMMVNNRRSELEIMSKILVLSKDGAKKTELLYQGNLSYAQLKGYLSFLLERNLLEESIVKNNGSSGKCYKPTEKGLNFLKDVNKVMVHLTL